MRKIIRMRRRYQVPGQPEDSHRLELEETRAVAAAKERLLLIHIQEMEELYQVLRARVKELEAARQENQEMFLAAMEALARTLEAKDRYTRGHSGRVAKYAVRLAAGLGLEDGFIENLRLAASLHDLGKIGVREEVLNKPGRLSPEEFALIKEHPLIGARILAPLAPLRELIPWIKHHHERYDGGGYPDGLKGEEISLGARVIALADSFDAMTTDRPYRKALPLEVALEEVRRGAGSQFDPELAVKWLELPWTELAQLPLTCH